MAESQRAPETLSDRLPLQAVVAALSAFGTWIGLTPLTTLVGRLTLLFPLRREYSLDFVTAWDYVTKVPAAEVGGQIGPSLLLPTLVFGPGPLLLTGIIVAVIILFFEALDWILRRLFRRSRQSRPLSEEVVSLFKLTYILVYVFLALSLLAAILDARPSSGREWLGYGLVALVLAISFVANRFVTQELARLSSLGSLRAVALSGAVGGIAYAILFAVLGAAVVTAGSVLLTRQPQLPCVKLNTEDGQEVGRYVGHSEGAWHVLYNDGFLRSIAEDRVYSAITFPRSKSKPASTCETDHQ